MYIYIGWDGLLIGAVSGSSILLESPGRFYYIYI